MNTANLSLYYYKTCPFCLRVLDFITKHSIKLELRDARQDSFREELIAGGGKKQVPCLRIEQSAGTQWLYESQAIIAFLQDSLQHDG